MTPAHDTPEPASPLDAALYYASIGWRVLPIRPGQKTPPMQSWQHAATTDPDVITNWYKGLYNGFGVGIATGSESGVFVLDVDISEGKQGDESLRDLEATHGPLPDTVRAITGTGGLHIFYNQPPGVDIRNNASTKLGAGLDIRGNGGQVVAAPTTHPNGRPYAWESGYGPDEIQVADAPAWLLNMLTEAPKPIEQPRQPQGPGTTLTGVRLAGDDSIAAHINDAHNWHDVLLADGWTIHSQTNGDTHWTRPGKDTRAGSSAVLHEPSGPFVVFSTDAGLATLHRPEASTAGGDGFAYSMFGYIAATRHDGDRSACATAYRQALTHQQAQTLTADRGAIAYAALTGTELPAAPSPFVDWGTFWTTDHTVAEWVAEPLIAEGRGHAIFAPGGTGKSLLSLWLAAAIATGRHGLTGERMTPRRVMYLDYEMTESDLHERLESMGYGPDDDLSRLSYALFPSIPPLDTAPGGALLVQMAQAAQADVVIIDTFIRAVEGDENEAGTTAAFDRFSGRQLKGAGIAWMRMDHAGKDTARGARGSSAKNDDVDVAWQMTANEEGYSLKAIKRRMGWVPETVGIIKRDEPTLRFTTSIEAAVPAGTVTIIELLDTLGVSPDATRRVAADAIRAAGHKVRNNVLAAAQKRRRMAAEREIYLTDRGNLGPQNRGPLVPTNDGDQDGDQWGPKYKTPGQTMGTKTGTSGDQPSQVNGDHWSPLMGDQWTTPTPGQPQHDMNDMPSTPESDPPAIDHGDLFA